MPTTRRFAVATTVIAICTMTVLTACSGGSSSSSGQGVIEKAKTTGTLTIGVKSDQPGLSLKTGDNYEGFDINIAKILAKGLGVEPENIQWKTTVSINREPFIEQGVVDLVVATYTINDKRKNVVSFGGPYYVAGQALLVDKDSSITAPGQMDGQVACSVVGSSSASNMEKSYPNVQLQLFDSYSKCVTALSGSGVQAVTTDNIILAGYAAQPHNVGKFKIPGEPFTTEPYGVGLKKSDVAGCNKVNEILAASAADGSYKAAYEQALGDSGLPFTPLDTSLLTNCPKGV